MGRDPEHQFIILALGHERRDAAFHMPFQGLVAEPEFLRYVDDRLHPDPHDQLDGAALDRREQDLLHDGIPDLHAATLILPLGIGGHDVLREDAVVQKDLLRMPAVHGVYPDLVRPGAKL